MTGIAISALPAAASVLSTDIYPAVQGGVTVRENVAQLTTFMNANVQLGSSAQVSGLNTSLAGFLPLAGGTMTGNLILNGNPTVPNQAANKAYVDNFGAGITVILSCAAATTANLNATAAGAGVGATLTNNGALAAFAVDGYSASVNDRILVKNQTASQHNGVYIVTTVGSGAVAWVLTRSTDYDQAPAEIKPGTLVAVNNGTVNATTSWLETATVVTVDTDPISFSQFTFAPSSFFLIANNLSEGTPATMRTNLGLGTAAQQNTAFFCQTANNLSDVVAATALVNLGLGTPTGTGNVVRQTSPTLVTPILGTATATTLAFSPTTGGIIGTTAADNASAGNVGEFMSSVVNAAGAVSCSNNVSRNITSITLTAGDWDVWGNVSQTNSIPSTGFATFGWVSSVSATLPDLSLYAVSNQATGTLGLAGLAVPMLRFNVNANTVVYLSTKSIFGSGTTTACGAIYARRRR